MMDFELKKFTVHSFIEFLFKFPAQFQVFFLFLQVKN